jgi:2'-5' RNA ligase
VASGRSATIRLFVGVYPTPEVVERLRGLLSGLALAEHRPVPAEQVHLTLQFIGEVRMNHLRDVTESVERSAAGIEPFTLTPLMLATLPESGTARLVAAMTDAPAGLVEMHRRLVHRLARHVRAGAKERFTPHMTLCRFVHGVRAERVGAALEGPGLAFEVTRVSLMKSELRPDGAVHAEVVGVELGRGTR